MMVQGCSFTPAHRRHRRGMMAGIDIGQCQAIIEERYLDLSSSGVRSIHWYYSGVRKSSIVAGGATVRADWSRSGLAKRTASSCSSAKPWKQSSIHRADG